MQYHVTTNTALTEVQSQMSEMMGMLVTWQPNRGLLSSRIEIWNIQREVPNTVSTLSRPQQPQARYPITFHMTSKKLLMGIYMLVDQELSRRVRHHQADHNMPNLRQRKSETVNAQRHGATYPCFRAR